MSEIKCCKAWMSISSKSNFKSELICLLFVFARFISHCSSYLHSSHYYMTDVSLALAQMIGQDSEQGLAAVSEDRLLLKTQLCRKLADLIEILAPGIHTHLTSHSVRWGTSPNTLK